jgi:hypothetical protein
MSKANIETSRCYYHPGRNGVRLINGRGYCQECELGIKEAAKRVDRHVEPQGCFVWYKKSDIWEPITGTGCAHWVAHQLGFRNIGYGFKCIEGFAVEIPDIIQGLQTVTIDEVQINDIYVMPDGKHMGLVTKLVRKNEMTSSLQQSTRQASGSKLFEQIIITHDSSRQNRVAENEFFTFFHGVGRFYRM